MQRHVLRESNPEDGVGGDGKPGERGRLVGVDVESRQSQRAAHGNEHRQINRTAGGIERVEHVEYNHARRDAKTHQVAERVEFLANAAHGVQQARTEPVEEVGESRNAYQDVGHLIAQQAANDGLIAVKRGNHGQRAAHQVHAGDAVGDIVANKLENLHDSREKREFVPAEPAMVHR